VAKKATAKQARRRARAAGQADYLRADQPTGDGKARRRRKPRKREISSETSPPQDQAQRPSVPLATTGELRAIESSPPSLRRYFADTWRLRSAFAYFVQRYARKRIGRTFFGSLWFFLPVLLPLFVGTLVFGGILGVSVPGVPYFLYFAVALSAWLLFSQTAYFATRSLEISRSEVRRVYVPRLLPLTAAMTLPAVNFLVYALLIACALGFYVVTDGEFYLALRPATLLVIPALVMLLVFAWAIGLWFSTLAPRARDVRRMAGYVLGVWYFLTPVMYPIDEIPAGWQFMASLNPATAPIELIKDGLLDVGEVTTLGLAMYFGWLVVTIVGGLLIFVPRERRDIAFY
jgi:lipopolysaccharide transport system permease protein